MAFAEDMSVFFDAAGFAVSATFVPSSGGAAQTATVIFDMPTEEMLGADSVSVEYSMMYAHDQLTSIKKGDRGVIEGVQYRIRDIRPLSDNGIADGRVKIAKLTKI